jgi:hypothetical protein
MSIAFKGVDKWYTKEYPAFVSTNGNRQSPPMGTSLDCVGGGFTGSGVGDWIEPPDTKGSDFLDWMQKALRLNKHLMASEYEFEASVKACCKQSDIIRICNMGTDQETTLRVDQIFQKSDVTYGSWSFLYALSRAAVRFGLGDLKLDSGGFSAAPAALVSAFKIYDKKFSVNSSPALEKKLLQSQDVANKFIMCLYNYNCRKTEYRAQASGSIGHSYLGLDKNFIQSFKKAWCDGRMMKAYTRLNKRGKTDVASEMWRVVMPPLFKQLRLDIETRRATQQMLNPVRINEKNFRRVVSDMIDFVFTGTDKWDEVEVNYTVDEHGVEDVGERDRFNVALCLLQLGIGSRSRGIIAVNQIEQLDVPVVGELALMRSLDPRASLRVKYLTKDKPVEWKAFKTFKRLSEFDSDFTLFDAVQLVHTESEVDVIDKPFQYYLFDPLSHYAAQGITLASHTVYAGRNHHPREIYMQLLHTCRNYVHDKHPETVKWETYKTGGREIWVVSKHDRLSENLSKVYRSIYPGMKAVCERYLKRPELCMESFGTHELRRLYVCYSYEFFGRGKTKEIAYAQYVLRHVSLTSTVYYTTMQFEMFLAGGCRDEIKAREDMIATLAFVEDAVVNLKRKVLDVEQDAFDQAKRLRTEGIAFVVDGREVLVDRLPHAKKGISRDFLVARGTLKGEELKGLGVKVTKRGLRLLGVNNLIVDDVYARLTPQIVVDV